MQAKGGSSGLVQSRPQATGPDEPGGENSEPRVGAPSSSGAS